MKERTKERKKEQKKARTKERKKERKKRNHGKKELFIFKKERRPDTQLPRLRTSGQGRLFNVTRAIRQEQ